jgi:catechol 2,3-dioxygenase-like lactoylglutathione lyase family enzyme
MESPRSFIIGAVSGVAVCAALHHLRHRYDKQQHQQQHPEAARAAHMNQSGRGLQPLLHQLNHVALIVRDVGESLHFYSDIIGFEQIRRPNFDRHGAWLTMGNVELHLIKGEPACRRGQHPKDLIVSHLAIEVTDSEKVLERLRALKKDHYEHLTWRQNISVPTPAASRTEKFESGHEHSGGKVTQFFLEDPDGYWMELCNCEVLTEFCFGMDDKHGDHHPAFRYQEGCEGVGIHGLVDTVVKAHRWMRKASLHVDHWDKVKHVHAHCAPISLAEVDQDKLENLKKRRNTYGDMCQGFSEEDLTLALSKSGNSIPDAILILKHGRKELGQHFSPPNYLIESERLSQNETFFMPVHSEPKVDWGEKRTHSFRADDCHPAFSGAATTGAGKSSS